MKCVIAEKIHEKGVDVLKNYMDVELAYDKGRDYLKEVLPDYDVLLVRSDTPVDKELIDIGVNLKVIGMAGIGLNGIDVEYAKLKNIAVFNVPDGSFNSVAEITIAFMLNCFRGIIPAIKDTKSGQWHKTGFTGHLLRGKTVGILSLGRIGRRVAQLCQVFGMKVIAFDPYIHPEIAEVMNVELLPLEKVLSKSDVISIHTPLKKETYHMIGKEQLELMKDGSFILNLGRGGIVHEDALYDAIVSGKIKAAAFDVMEEEPPKHHKLFDLDNFIITPHIGAGTEEAQEYISTSLANQVINYFNLNNKTADES
jgi:D-3-phosphoglycerate dehydrogenase